MNAVITRQLGRSGIQVSALGMGCWAIGGSGWGGGADDDQSIRGIHRALEMGINFYDTADAYGDGHSEGILARAFEGRRDQVVIATKFGFLFTEATRQRPGGNAEPQSIRELCEASLRRLNTDYIDLYQFHINDFPADQAEPVRATLESLVAEGKIRTYGWSTDFPDRARVFAQGQHCSAIQVELNVIDDAADILAVCDEFDLAAINRGPLAMGLLTGKYTPASTLPSDDVRGPNAPAWMKYFKDGQPNPEWLDKVNAVGEVLRSGGRILAQGALGWLWARSEHTIPIPGFRTLAQVEENAGALAHGALSAAQMREIDALLER
jgi:aryl-alcohol dehydrogenase-like predicted oxidoreductase